MGVAVDQAGQHRHVRQVDDRCALGNCELRAHGLDLRAAHENELVVERTPGLDIDELAGADGDHRGDGRCLLGGTIRG